MFSSIMEAGKKPSVLTSISDGLCMLLFNVWRDERERT